MKSSTHSHVQPLAQGRVSVIESTTLPLLEFVALVIMIYPLNCQFQPPNSLPDRHPIKAYTTPYPQLRSLTSSDIEPTPGSRPAAWASRACRVSVSGMGAGLPRCAFLSDGCLELKRLARVRQSYCRARISAVSAAGLGTRRGTGILSVCNPAPGRIRPLSDTLLRETPPHAACGRAAFVSSRGIPHDRKAHPIARRCSPSGRSGRARDRPAGDQHVRASPISLPSDLGTARGAVRGLARRRHRWPEHVGPERPHLLRSGLRRQRLHPYARRHRLLVSSRAGG